ncbi:Gfo/Idh/MocA family oxidoreductase [Puniceicoccales bacterium CK1056]|uniref:Gfo/Idh/MocA family oxidoreductase n=1 Tax=Oceanipulchritudo coccoides TaxID=2706888 RepID=A0A6B2M108_9BACT|nr:Gfo/Idh/MocA family oxidoreductase [Oceanipulchritudo coccoides]NDV61727.1 Gfo/Idh/MocA family oxidoreductase [Oceanipulchritudo coccoides]
MLKAGILGLGEGRSALAAISSMENWQTRWICDLDQQLLDARKSEFSISRTTTDYDEMLADPEVDVIFIYTPDPFHADHILKAFSAGKHVFCTKPLVDSLEKGQELLKAQKASGKELIVGHTSRFYPTTMQQYSDFKEGRLGEIVSCETHYNSDKRLGSAGKRGKKGEVNWLYSGLCHPLDLVFWFLGPIKSVSAMSVLSPAGKRLGSRVPDSFHAVLKAETGALGQVSGVYGAASTVQEAHPQSGCILRGDKGSSVASAPQFEYSTNLDGFPQTTSSFPDDAGEYFPWGGSKYHVGETRNLLVHFAECLQRQQSPRPNLKDGLKVVAILKAIQLSMESNCQVEVSDVLRKYGLVDL